MLVASGFDLAEWRDFDFREGAGCIECGGTGYRGRTAIHELLDLTDPIREMILEKKPTSEVRKLAQQEGMKFLRESAMDRVRRGLTTLKEINKVTFIEASTVTMPIPFRIFSPEHRTCDRIWRARLRLRACWPRVRQSRAAGGDEFAPLPAGVVKPGLAEANLTDQAVVVAALRKALDDVSASEKQLTLVVPDAAVRVLLLDFDTLPAKVQEALPIVRFRLRKLMPFEVDDAAVSYQVMAEE